MSKTPTIRPRRLRGTRLAAPILLTLATIWPGLGTLLEASDVRDALVKIYAVQNKQNYQTPWKAGRVLRATGSGALVSGNRILTNAHVVSNHTFVQVRRYGQSRKLPAEVVAISHQADLALLSVAEPEFFDGVEPLDFGELPQVQEKVVVYGFPTGGDTLSATEGVVSRIEHQRYAHSGIDLLAVQLDAAINGGNSGGPVLGADGKIRGVVMQSLTNADGIGYMVPTPVVSHFLRDLEDGEVNGFPASGFLWQPMESESLKRMFGVTESEGGVLVTGIVPGTPADGKLRTHDIVLAIDGHAVGSDGTVEFRSRERTSMLHCVQSRQLGETTTLTVFREGERLDLTLQLDTPLDDIQLVPLNRYDVRPTYYIYGGLVFNPLTLDYLMSWGNKWWDDAPSGLVNLLRDLRKEEGDEIVVLNRVLPSTSNNGYHNWADWRFTQVNGQRFHNLREMIALVESASGEFIVLKDDRGRTLVLDRERSEREQPSILKTYGVTEDRSEDLEPTRTARSADEPAN